MLAIAETIPKSKYKRYKNKHSPEIKTKFPDVLPNGGN